MSNKITRKLTKTIQITIVSIYNSIALAFSGIAGTAGGVGNNAMSVATD